MENEGEGTIDDSLDIGQRENGFERCNFDAIFFFRSLYLPPPSPSPPSFPLVFPWFEWSEVVTRKEREGKGEREEKEKKEEKEDGGSFRWSVIDRIWRGSNFGGGCTRFRPPKAGEESRWVLPGRGRGEGRNPRC